LPLLVGLEALASGSVAMISLFTDSYRINDLSTWNPLQLIAFCLVIWIGLEVMQQYVPQIFILLGHPKLIEMRGKVKSTSFSPHRYL
jgi:hypothetical protein